MASVVVLKFDITSVNHTAQPWELGEEPGRGVPDRLACFKPGGALPPLHVFSTEIKQPPGDKNNQVYIGCSDATKVDSIYGSHML